MKLAVDAFNLAADRRGMGRYVRSVLRGLDAIGGAEVTLIARDRDVPALREEFAYPIAHAREIRRLAPDAVWYCWNGMRFAPHAPSIATIYDPFAFSEPHPNPIARWREQAPIRRSLRKADALTTISAWTGRELRARFGVRADRVTVAPPVVENFWHPVETRAIGEPYFLIVAGPERRKNIAFFVGVFEAAFANRDMKLVVAGNLSDADLVNPNDMRLRELYSDALAVAVPSLAEGYGIVVLEAMACGAPVIAADATALPEASGGAALLVAPSDRDAWIDALRSVASNAELRTDLRRRGLARVALIDPLAPARTLLSVLARVRNDRS